MTEDLLRRAILALKGAADAESYGYPDEYYELLAEYHRLHDASWMPEGYSVVRYGPGNPHPPVDMSQLALLDNSPSLLAEWVSSLRGPESTHVWL